MHTIYRISEKEREELSQPPCKIFTNTQELLNFIEKRKPKLITCVGDVVSDEIDKWNISIVDNLSRRKPYVAKKQIEVPIAFETENPRGCITREAWNVVKKAFCFSCRTRAIVKGEEDLLGLAALYFSPKDSLVIFGLREAGIGCFDTNEVHREFVKKYVKCLEKEELVLVGGTFDTLHAGHKYLLLSAFEIARKVMIGLTSDEFVRKYKNYEPKPFNERLRSLKDFLGEFGLLERCEIVKLDNPYGITLEIEKAAILVSEETLPRAKEINEIRKRRNLSPLQIYVVERILAQDNKPISCERIRKGEIDENGFLL
jgi:pantetheine-phosphate adenylyltransferase